MTTTADVDWRPHAEQLADALAGNGDLRSPCWRAAIAAVPRHILVPHAYEQNPTTGRWSGFDTASDLGRVYSPETLITALEPCDGGEAAVSSSTKPDLMVRMLETLDVHDGLRVLEIGTGSGYNAALLSHRLGDQRVYSVDVDAELVTLARVRLGAAGHHPTVVVGDGARGLPEHAPFDRMIATCSVPAVPWEWAEQLAPDGAILVDVKLGIGAGNLALLRRVDDRLEGHFTPRWAAFMEMRAPHRPAPTRWADRAAAARTRFTDIPPTRWSADTAAWFLAHLQLPAGMRFGFDLDPATRQPVASTLAAPDGSWARRPHTDETVTEGGPTPLWRHIEWGYDQWMQAGQPRWEQMGLTVTADGTHTLWVEDATGPSWPLPTRSRG